MNRSASDAPFVPLFAKIAVIVAALLAAKVAVHLIGLDVIDLTRLHTAFTTGVLFTIAIIFSGTLADFKEAERIPGEMAVALKSIHTDAPLTSHDPAAVTAMQAHVAELLKTILANFRQDSWRLREIRAAADKIDADIRLMAAAGGPPQFLVKLRVDLATVERCAHRVESIMQTTFVPMAYIIAEIAVVALLLNLLFVTMDPLHEGLAILGALAFLLISLLLLIRDMDNPFSGYARVDLSLLHKLERYLDER